MPGLHQEFSPFLTLGFYAAGTTFDGQIVSRATLNSQYPQLFSGSSSSFAMNDMFIPPSYRPLISQVGPFCADQDTIVNLETYWLCQE